MQIVTLDFETFFDADYTLKKLTTEGYIRNPLFAVHGLGVRWGTGKKQWLRDPKEFVEAIRVQPEPAALLCHHAHFDGLILSHHYGVTPHAWLDTLSMGRAIHGNSLKLGLDALAKHYGLKGKTIDYDAFKGKKPGSFDDSSLAEGCLHDVELTWQLFNKLAKGFPEEEYRVIDLTIRMFTEPRFIGDKQKLGEIWSEENERKSTILARLGISAADVQSGAKFSALLAEQGIDVPSKEGKNGPIPCIAKTDEFLQSLRDHDIPTVRDLAEARLGVRSTIDQTRAERLGFMATRGAMPVYLGYAAAHTKRWGGGDKVNWQNLRRGGKLREAIGVPAGYSIIKADKSQIECRLLEAIAGEDLSDFIERKDPYVGLASEFYGREIAKEDKEERQFGKVLRLQCGYGAGALSIVRAAKNAAIPVLLSEDEGLRARDLYRASKPGVVALWGQAGRLISALSENQYIIPWNVVHIETGRMILPNGLALTYPDLKYDGDNWTYLSRQGRVKLYGAKLVENLIQALSRLDMSQTLLRLLDRGLRPVILEHDAAAFVVLDKDVEQAQIAIEEEFCRAPAWLPHIPLGCEVTIGKRYG